MGLYIVKFLSECLSPTCIEDCIIEHDYCTQSGEVYSTIELTLPPPPELNIDLEAGRIDGIFGTLTASCESIQEIETDKSLPESNIINPINDNSEEDTNSNPSDETFDYGVIALPIDDREKNNDADCNTLSDDSISDDDIIVV